MVNGWHCGADSNSILQVKPSLGSPSHSIFASSGCRFGTERHDWPKEFLEKRRKGGFAVLLEAAKKAAAEKKAQAALEAVSKATVPQCSTIMMSIRNCVHEQPLATRKSQRAPQSRTPYLNSKILADADARSFNTYKSRDV